MRFFMWICGYVLCFYVEMWFMDAPNNVQEKKRPLLSLGRNYLQWAVDLTFRVTLDCWWIATLFDRLRSVTVDLRRY